MSGSARCCPPSRCFSSLLFARRLFSRFIIRAIKAFTKRTSSDIDDEILAAVEEPLRFVFVVAGVYAAGQVAPFPEAVNGVLDKLVRSLIAFTIFWTVYRCVEPLSHLLDKLTGVFGTGFAFPSSSLYVEKMPFGRPDAYPGPEAPNETAPEVTAKVKE